MNDSKSQWFIYNSRNYKRPIAHKAWEIVEIIYNSRNYKRPIAVVRYSGACSTSTIVEIIKGL